MANFRKLKGGHVSSHTRLRGIVLQGHYHRVEFVGDAKHDKWRITRTAASPGGEEKEYHFESTLLPDGSEDPLNTGRRKAQLFLDSLR